MNTENFTYNSNKDAIGNVTIGGICQNLLIYVTIGEDNRLGHTTGFKISKHYHLSHNQQ